tara:strand:+ start:5330 stop:6430 length:1101 start_codon:yes stop_codon:yes gene_type:complete
MKKNKIILVLLMSSMTSLAYSTDFKIIIGQEENAYTSGKLTVTESEWINVGSETCSFDKEQSEVYYDINFTQTETCNQSQEKTIITKKVISDGSEIIIDVDKKTKIETTINQFSKNGTHLENSCKEIQDFESTLPSGNYTLSLSGNPVVECDMVRHGGGWTKVIAYDWYSDKNNTPIGYQSTTNKIIKDTTDKNYAVIDGFWVDDWTDIARGTIGRWKEIEAQPITPWKQAFIDFEGIVFRSLDGFKPVETSELTDNDHLESEYLDGYNFTYGELGSLNHLFSLPVGYDNDSHILDNQLSWLNREEMKYTFMSTNVSGYTYNLKFEKEIITKVKPQGLEKIRFRSMADQYVNDETVGFRKYILWVK